MTNKNVGANCVRPIRKILSLVLSIAIFCTMLAAFNLNASAEGTSWTKGEGTGANPYLIETPEQLEYLAEQTNAGNAFADTYFKLTTNLDLSAYENWQPIGYSDEAGLYFSGHFDGGNNTITGLNTTGKVGESYVQSGLFGCVMSGFISNLTIDGANVSATGLGEYGFAGGLVGVAYTSTIENCYVFNSTVNVARVPNQSCCAGGLAGYSASSIFNNCGVYNTNVSTTDYGGGFVGETDDSYETTNTAFNKCYVMNTTITCNSDTAQTPTTIGGFIGKVTDCDNITATNCFVSGVTIKENADNKASSIGGVFVGDFFSGKLTATNCYADGSATVDFSRGVFGEQKNVALINCYYNSDKATSSAIEGLTGKDNIQIKSSELADLLGSEFIYSKGMVMLSGITMPDIPDIRNTPVTATATIPEPTYTVTIPEAVDFGDQKQALEKYRNTTNDQFGEAVIVSKPFTVSATGVSNLFNDLDDGKDDHINVTATFDGTLKGTASTENTVPYIIKQGDSTLATGGKIATFYNDVDLASKGKTNSAEATIYMNRADIKNADSYSGTMTFTIAVADRANG